MPRSLASPAIYLVNLVKLTLRPQEPLGTSQKLNQTAANLSASVVREKDETDGSIRLGFTNRWPSCAKQLY
jgi:hypothetical protein